MPPAWWSQKRLRVVPTSNENQRTLLLEKIPVKRLGTVQDIAHACVYLASDWANYVTGNTLHINGGMYMN